MQAASALPTSAAAVLGGDPAAGSGDAVGADAFTSALAALMSVLGPAGQIVALDPAGGPGGSEAAPAGAGAGASLFQIASAPGQAASTASVAAALLSGGGGPAIAGALQT